ncbi:hypothetical protein H634G_11829, partial [Metarhizium anisopliae BRIP 53293]
LLNAARQRMTSQTPGSRSTQSGRYLSPKKSRWRKQKTLPSRRAAPRPEPTTSRSSCCK